MKDIHRFIDDTIEAEAAEGKALVFPLQCGIGKSSHIRRMIAEALTRNDGLIVVTDTIAGLKNLAGLPPQDKAFQDYLSEFEDSEQKEYIRYLSSNRNRIAFLDHETVKAELPKLYGRNGKPIVLMTAQRFVSLSADEIRHLTSGAIQRKTIVFDEKPLFTEQRKITVEQLNDIDTALKMSLDEKAQGKTFLTDHWFKVSEMVQGLFKWYEDQTATGKEFTAWHAPQADVDQLNTGHFLHLVNETYKTDIDNYSFYNDSDIRKNINAVFQALTEGATFTSRKRSGRKAQDGTRYENYLTVVLSNAELFLNVGAKVIVFDGTADIHPDYNLDFVQMVDCSAYRPPLDNLTVRIIDVNTSKNHLRQCKPLLSAIAQDVKARYGSPVIFCHMEQERNLKAMGFSAIDHFGNLKGRNDWRESDTIVQIGLNRFPDETYILSTYYNELYTSRRSKRNYKEIERIRAKLENREPNYVNLPDDEGFHVPQSVKVVTESKIAETRNRSLIADTEQNLFRGAIRDGKPMLFVLYAQAHEIDSGSKQRVENNFVQLVRERYERSGATVEVIDAPEIKISSRKGKTVAQRIVAWCQAQSSGRQFKIKHMLAEVSLSNQEYQQTRRANKGIKRMFDAMQIEGRKGWYMIPVK